MGKKVGRRVNVKGKDLTPVTESLIRRAVKIEMNGETTEKTTGDRAGAKSGLARTREILSVGP